MSSEGNPRPVSPQPKDSHLYGAELLAADGEYAVFHLAGPKKPQPGGLDVVFFHGLQLKAKNNEKAWWKTWLSGDGKQLWPKDWLPDELQEKGINARILSVRYNAGAFRDYKKANASIDTAAVTIYHLLVGTGVEIGGRNYDGLEHEKTRIAFVGHSLGGLIIKNLVIIAHEIRNSESCSMPAGQDDGGELNRRMHAITLLDNLCGIAFYATPHRGSSLADFARRFAHPFLGTTRLLLALTRSNDEAHTLNTRFHHVYVRGPGKGLRCFCEGKPTKLVKWLPDCLSPYEVVVTEESASLDGVHTIEVDADHFEVCKPLNNRELRYSKLVAFLVQYNPRGALAQPGAPVDFQVEAAKRMVAAFQTALEAARTAEAEHEGSEGHRWSRLHALEHLGIGKQLLEAARGGSSHDQYNMLLRDLQRFKDRAESLQDYHNTGLASDQSALNTVQQAVQIYEDYLAALSGANP